MRMQANIMWLVHHALFLPHTPLKDTKPLPDQFLSNQASRNTTPLSVSWNWFHKIIRTSFPAQYPRVILIKQRLMILQNFYHPYFSHPSQWDLRHNGINFPKILKSLKNFVQFFKSLRLGTFYGLAKNWKAKIHQGPFVLKLFSAKFIRKLMRKPHEQIHGKTDEKPTKTMRKPQNEQEVLNLKQQKSLLLRQQKSAVRTK